MPFRHSRAARGSHIKRHTFWASSAIVTDFTALAAATAVLDQTALFSQDATIVRTRGTLWVGTDQNSADEYPFGALGFVVVRNEAAAIGVTALPTPAADADSDNWFVHQYWAHSLVLGTAVGFSSPEMSRYDFDSKAMRKINAGDTVAILLENENATDACRFILQFRMLIKTTA